MLCDLPGVSIAPLAEYHLREDFSCGNAIIDTFLRKRAWKDHEENKVRVRVACDSDNKVLGFYSLSLKTLAAKAIGGRIGSAYGKWPIPTVYLSMIGTHVDCQGKGLGSDLMLHAFDRTLEIADLAGTACLTLDSVDQDKAEWYEGLSFKRVEPGGLLMYIPLGTLKEACEAARAAEAASNDNPLNEAAAATEA